MKCFELVDPRNEKFPQSWNVERRIQLSPPKIDTTNWWSTGRIQPPAILYLYTHIHTLQALGGLYFAGSYCPHNSVLSKTWLLHTFRLTACPWDVSACNTFTPWEICLLDLPLQGWKFPIEQIPEERSFRMISSLLRLFSFLIINSLGILGIIIHFPKSDI